MVREQGWLISDEPDPPEVVDDIDDDITVNDDTTIQALLNIGLPGIQRGDDGGVWGQAQEDIIEG